MARDTENDTTGASKVRRQAAPRAVDAPLRDGRPGSWSALLGGVVIAIPLYPREG
jgi:hypothetical protein